MSTADRPLPDNDATMSNPQQLKRKSLDASPNPQENTNGDVPNKRPRIEDIPGRSPGREDAGGRNGNAGAKNGMEEQQESTARDVSLKEESSSPVARRPSGRSQLASPPEQRQRPDSRRGDLSPPGRGERRGSGPSRIYNTSPPRHPERRDSESSRIMSSSVREKDRQGREGLSQEDKRRGKRLFGGLLSTLSQTTTNSQQKRRQEIEKRQQERAAKQKIEDDKHRSNKLAKLERVRKIEQVRFDEQVMRTRHSNILAMAHSLQTKSEPRLYYRPWELTPEQEDLIKNQVHDVESQIEAELQQFKRRKEQRLKDLGILPSSSEVDAMAGEQVEAERSNNAAQVESATATATNDRKSSPIPATAAKISNHEERDHDEMVEAEEDTVIY